MLHQGDLLKDVKKIGREECGIHEITVKDIEELYEEQDGKCALSGQELSFTYTDNNIISIDRIDSDKGYTKDNIQLTTFIVNQAKSNLFLEEFQEMCINVAKNAGIFIPDKSHSKEKIYEIISELEDMIIEEHKKYRTIRDLYEKKIKKLEEIL